MKEAIGGSWLFMLVIAMVALFTGYISLSTNYTRCYNIKDEIITSLQICGGVNKCSLELIDDYLNNIGYRSTNDCPSGEGYVGFRVGSGVSTASSSTKDVNFCIAKTETYSTASGHPDMSYYRVLVFFQLDIPVFNEAFSIPVTGETSQIIPNEDDGSVHWPGGSS